MPTAVLTAVVRSRTYSYGGPVYPDLTLKMAPDIRDGVLVVSTRSNGETCLDHAAVVQLAHLFAYMAKAMEWPNPKVPS